MVGVSLGKTNNATLAERSVEAAITLQAHRYSSPNFGARRRIDIAQADFLRSRRYMPQHAEILS